MIRSAILLCSLVIFGLVGSIQAAPMLHKRFVGQGTFYSVGLGACGNTNNDNELVAALNAPQFGTPANPNNSPFCGRKVSINGPNGSVTCTIVDRCDGCKNGDLDLSPTAFAKIAPLSAGRVAINWDFVDEGSNNNNNNNNNTPAPPAPPAPPTPPAPTPTPPPKPKPKKKPRRKHRHHRHRHHH